MCGCACLGRTGSEVISTIRDCAAKHLLNRDCYSPRAVGRWYRRSRLDQSIMLRSFRRSPADLTQLRRVKGGWYAEGYPRFLPDYQAMISQDEYVWLFYQTLPDGSESGVICLFVPQSSV